MRIPLAALRLWIRSTSSPTYLPPISPVSLLKALSDFLEEKRQRFPRFYFIGDDDLLEILGQAKNPTVIQTHLKKLFAGIHKVPIRRDPFRWPTCHTLHLPHDPPACCSLLAARHLLLAARYSLLAARCSLLATCCSLLAAHYLLLATCCSLRDVRPSPRGAACGYLHSLLIECVRKAPSPTTTTAYCPLPTPHRSSSQRTTRPSRTCAPSMAR